MNSLPILVLNSGSSSIKFSMWEGSGAPQKLIDGAIDGIGVDNGLTAKFHVKSWLDGNKGSTIVNQAPSAPDLAAAFALISNALRQPSIPQPAAIGHRMVCGGPTVTENQRITPALIAEMEKYTSFAPLHAPSEIFLMREAAKLHPETPGFVCLDSWFHRDLPEITRTLPIPHEYTELGLRRFGAHGLSYESIVAHLSPQVPSRLIAAHLGNGASICAVRDGKSIDTSMGLTPTGGIISGTRTGDLDPGVVVFLLRKIAESEPDTNKAAQKLEAILNKQSGLKGLSRHTSDMRQLRESLAGSDMVGRAIATLATAEFAYVLRKYIGAYAAALGGLDMLVFTGGIGENDPDTRADACNQLDYLGVRIDPEYNRAAKGEAVISAEDSAVKVLVIPAAEDLTIVKHVRELLT